MQKLMDFREMEQKYSGGEDALVLTVVKWSRIYEFLESAFTLEHFSEALQAAVVPIFLCVEYRDRCEFCPLFRVCERGKSQVFQQGDTGHAVIHHCRRHIAAGTADGRDRQFSGGTEKVSK